MHQPTNKLLDRQRLQFAAAYEELNQEMQSTLALLDSYYHQASECLQSGKFIFNTSIIKELRMYLSQITKIATLAGSGASLFLLSMHAAQEQEPEEIDIEKYLQRHRDKTDLPLRKWCINEQHLGRIKNRCTSANSLMLISNPMDMQEMVTDADVTRIKPFSKISRLSLKASNITDSALQTINQLFDNLKELDISECRMVSSQGIKRLCGYKYVSVKLNACEGISQRSVLSLISTSYNLNYLQACNLKDCNYPQLLEQINEVYYHNKINFKWLQLTCNLGTILFVNKLAYLTHLTNAESITDREVEILLGDQPNIDGLYFNCCEELHSDTVGYIITHCQRLKRLCFRRFLNLTDSLVADVVSKLIKLEYLNLSQCYELTSRSLIQIANQLRKLKEISLFKCQHIDDQGLLYLIQKMPSLVSLNFAHCKNVTDRVIFQLSNHLPNLLALNAEKCEQLTNESLAFLSQRLLQLEQLVLNYCDHISDDSICLVAMRQRKLKRLEIEWCQVTQKCVSFIAENLNDLQIVNFNYCPAVCDESFTSLAKHAVKLQVLKLDSCDKLTTRAFMKLFESLRRMKHLDLKQCIGVTDMVLEQLCNNSRGELMHLDLSWCSKVTDKGVLALSQFQPQLLFLSLNGCSEVTDSAVGWLCSTMTQLQHLNLTLCDRLTDKSVIEISKSLLSLRTLYLCDLQKLTDASISLLAGIPNIQEMHLSGCLQISSSSLIALLHNLQKLQCLNISECSNIFAESLLFLIQRMRNLKRFSIASLQVQDKLLEMVGEYMHRLQWINLQYCRLLTDSAVLRLMQRIPCLIRMQLQNTQISERTKVLIFQQLSSRAAHYMYDG